MTTPKPPLVTLAEAEAMTECPPHFFVLARPGGYPKTKAECKKCGKPAEFNASVEQGWKGSHRG